MQLIRKLLSTPIAWLYTKTEWDWIPALWLTGKFKRQEALFGIPISPEFMAYIEGEREMRKQTSEIVRKKLLEVAEKLDREIMGEIKEDA